MVLDKLHTRGKIGLIELVRDIPAQRTKLTPFLLKWNTSLTKYVEKMLQTNNELRSRLFKISPLRQSKTATAFGGFDSRRAVKEIMNVQTPTVFVSTSIAGINEPTHIRDSNETFAKG